MSPVETTGRGLSPDDAFIGLVDHGLFSEKVPPCFTSRGLIAHVTAAHQNLLTETNNNNIRSLLRQTKHDYIRYSALRDTNVPRHMGIPHPESHIIQSLALKRHWNEIKQHCARPNTPITRIFARRKQDSPAIFQMNYKAPERFAQEEADIRFTTGAQFKVHVDISTCFPSIYTHSIPWALHTKPVAKTNRSFILPGNLLDAATQNTKDGQTNGLLIGPHASNVLSELILTSVDDVLLQNGYNKVYRHIDDYTFFASNYEQAEGFIRDLGMALREYQLSLNEKKTQICPLPCPINENWIRELSSFLFVTDETGQVRFSIVRHFLDLALSLVKQHGKVSILNYAIKMVPGNLNPRAKRLFAQEVINLSLSYPYLVTIVEEHVFEKFTYPGIETAVEAFANELLNIGLRKIHPDSIAYALYFALTRGFAIVHPAVSLLDVIAIDDCICDVLLLEYAIRQNDNAVADRIRQRAANLNGLETREGDAFWLLIYQSWTENELRTNGQEFLASLKQAGYSFLNLDQPAPVAQPAMAAP